MHKYIPLLTSILILSAVFFSQAGTIFAQPEQGTPGGNTEEQSTPGGQNGSTQSTTIALENPLSGISNVNDLLVALLNVLIVIATPIIVIFIILAGFKYVTAQGDTKQLEDARRALTYAIVGGVLIIGAVAIAEIIKNTVEAFR